MPAVSSSLEKIPQNPPISPALRPETIRHPDKRSKLENDATCGLGPAQACLSVEAAITEHNSGDVLGIQDYALKRADRC